MKKNTIENIFKPSALNTFLNRAEDCTEEQFFIFGESSLGIGSHMHIQRSKKTQTGRDFYYQGN